MPPESLTIRPAVPGDLPILVELLEVLFGIEADFSPDPERQRRGLALMLESPRGRVLVAAQGGQVVGMITGQLVISTAQGAPSLWVEDLVVATPWRGMGVGRVLMEAILAWGAREGATRAQLLADRENPPALDFHHRLGWRSTQLICLRHAQETEA